MRHRVCSWDYIGTAVIRISGYVAALLTSAVFLLNPSTVRAETFVPTTSAEWVDANNWNPPTIPNGVGATAIFETPTGTRTVSLASNVIVGTLSFTNNSTFTTSIGATNATGGQMIFDAAGAGPVTITESGTGAQVDAIAATMIFNDDVIIDVQNAVGGASGAFRIGGPITGPGGLTKNGPGVLTVAFTPSQTGFFKDYTGPTIINAGRFRISSGGTPRMTSSATVNAGGQIVFASSNAIFSFGSGLVTLPNLNLNGIGLTAFPGAIRADQGASIVNNPIVLQSNTAINVVSVSVTGGNVASLEFNNTVSGPGILTMGYRPGIFDRRGTLILSAANTYSNGTIIEQGAIRVDGAGTLGTGTVMVDGAQVAGDPSFDTYGALVLNTNTAVADTAYLNLTGGGAASTPDRGYVDLASGADEVVGGLMLGGVIFGAGTYGSSASAAPLANQFDEFFAGTGTVTVVPAGVPGDYNNNGVVDAADYVVWRKGGTLANDFTPGVQAADYDFWRSRFGANTNPGSGSGLGLDASAVPEPTTIALTGCLVSLLVVARRRKP
jgi:autotransporter-associated beta strand protein